MTTSTLSPADLEVLEFERATWKYEGRREQVILERFGTTTTVHATRVLKLLEHPAAAEYAPQLVARLRRIRDARRGHRSYQRNHQEAHA